MTNSITCEISNLQRNSDGRFLPVMKAWLEQTSGAYDIMNAFKRTCTLFRLDFFKNQADGYLDGASAIRLPSVTIATAQRLKEAKSEKKTATVVVDVTRQLSDMGSTVCYAGAFVQKNPQSILKTASIFDVLYDAMDFGFNAIRYRRLIDFQTEAQIAAPEIQQDIQSEKNHTLFQLIRTVTAIATSFLGCFLLMTGTSLVPAVAAVTIAIANSILTIFVHYHKNYWCNIQFKIC
jgi:hypothetical protein